MPQQAFSRQAALRIGLAPDENSTNYFLHDTHDAGSLACRLRVDDGPTGSYSGPEVLFEEIATHLLQARFWPTGKQ